MSNAIPTFTFAQTLLLAAFTAAVTLFGSITTAVITAKSAERAADVALFQSCISRLDDEEGTFRNQAVAFLGALGNFDSSFEKKAQSEAEIQADLRDLRKAAYVLSANGYSEMSNIGVSLSRKTATLVNEEDFEVRKLAAKEADELSSKLQAELRQIRARFKEARAMCSSQTS